MRLTVLKNNVPTDEVKVETPDSSEQYEIYVGRSEDCHVRIDDPLISRHHFVLTNDGPMWSCHKKSTLGSLSINGRSAEVMPVSSGDEIKFGSYSLLVSELPEPKIHSPEPIIQATTPIYLPQEELKSVVQSIPEPKIEIPEEVIEESLSLSDEDNSSDSFEELSDSPGEEVNFGAHSSFEDDEESLSSKPIEDSPVEYADSGDESLDFGNEEESGQEEFSSAVSSQDMTGTRLDNLFVNFQLILFGEHAPYDRFQITQNEIFIGRDTKKCQIILNDPEVSSVHATIRKNGSELILEDLNSSNGTILNGERINRSHIATGDEFVIGSTSFTLEVKSLLLEAESDRLMPVEAGQTIEQEEIEEISISQDEDEDFSQNVTIEKSIIKRILNNPEQRKKAIYGIVAVGLMFILFYEPEPEEIKDPKKATTAKTQTVQVQPKVQLSQELENKRNVAYELGVSFFEQNKYFEALKEFQTVADIDPTYKKNQTYLEQTKIGLKRMEELEAQKRAEEERIKTKKIVEDLLIKAREAVAEKKVTVAENYFSQITEKDPENIEVQQLKIELEAWQREEERKNLERAAKEAARKAMVDALAPGKTFYLKKEWYRAILKLEEFLRRKGTDEDLVKEASDMLSDSKTQLSSDLGPLIGKARSLKEGQDLKSAYEAFLEVLKIEPTNAEALNEVDDIKNQLDSRSKRIYREAIIAESLSLFNDAKEKFQEVQQTSPTDSDYYKKASEKLKNYLE